MIACVMQDDRLFSGSIRENICGFAEETDDEWMTECARASHIHDVIMKMPMGYETLIGELGEGLSGGQKQRVAIAGVLALEPKCIVLDEPTAMLDPQGRKEIVTTVKKLNREKGITVVYITHYMEEALQADRIIVMGEGKLKMQGTPKEVFSHVRELYALGLEAPLAAKIADDLRQSGLNLQQGIITNEELAESICR